MRKKLKQYPIVTITHYKDDNWELIIHWNQWDSFYFSADTKALILQQLRKTMKYTYKCLKQDVVRYQEVLETRKSMLNELLKVYNKKEFGAVYQIEEK